MNKNNEMTQIISVNKISIPVQDSNLGSKILKTILYVKNNEYACSQGIGEDDWVISNGTIINLEDAMNHYFKV